MNCFNLGITQKIRLIQREDAGYAISSHDRGKTSVVYLNAAHVVRNHQLAPYRIDSFAVWQESHGALDMFEPLVGFGNCESVPVPVNRPGAHIPKLSNVLQREAKFRSPPSQPLNCYPDEFVLGIVVP
jgi:hypothetical protein